MKSIQRATTTICLLGLLVKIQTQVTYIFAFGHQFVQILSSFEQIIQIFVANVFYLLQLVLQFLELVYLFRILVFFYKLVEFVPF